MRTNSLGRFVSCITSTWLFCFSPIGFWVPPRLFDKHSTSPSFDMSSRPTSTKRFKRNGAACRVTYSSTIPALGVLPRNGQRKKKYGLLPLIQTIQKRVEETSNLGDLGKLPTKLIFLVLDELQIHAKAALAVTSTSFLKFAGSSCWDLMNMFESPDENMIFLYALERDMTHKQPKLACSHCLSLHEPSMYDTTSRGTNSSKTRYCYKTYQEVHLAQRLQLSWKDMVKFPHNESRTEFAMIYVDRGDENPYHSQPVLQGGYIHMTVEMTKIDSCLYAETRWEIPEATRYARSACENPLRAYMRQISGWLCPHSTWTAFWLSSFCARTNPDRDADICFCFARKRCRYCSTEFGMVIETLADDTECLVVTTWRLLGDDRDPECRE